MLILDGKKVRDEIKARLKKEIDSRGEASPKPTLAILQVGENPESTRYIEQKKIFGAEIGAVVSHIKFPEDVTQVEIIEKIKTLNADAATHGIIVQIPIPKHLDKDTIIDTIDPRKDVDGLTAANVKKLWANDESGLIPATALGVVTLLDFYRITLARRRVAVVGRSELVGKPLFLALTNRDATVTLCHSKTENLAEITKQADIIVVATGKPHFITKDYVSPNQVVVDVGINLITGTKFEEEIPDKKLVGDVHFEEVKDIVSAISPVPGGVGPLTVASLFENLLKSFIISTK